MIFETYSGHIIQESNIGSWKEKKLRVGWNGSDELTWSNKFRQNFLFLEMFLVISQKGSPRSWEI